MTSEHYGLAVDVIDILESCDLIVDKIGGIRNHNGQQSLLKGSHHPHAGLNGEFLLILIHSAVDYIIGGRGLDLFLDGLGKILLLLTHRIKADGGL